MDGRESELEAAGRSSGEPASGLLRYMSGMIVENQLNRGAGRIGGIKEPEEFDELAAAVAVSDQGMNLPGEQIDPSQQADEGVAGSKTARFMESVAIGQRRSTQR